MLRRSPYCVRAATLTIAIGFLDVGFARADCASIQAAINALPPSGGTVTIPPGTTTCSSALSATNKSVTFLGSGPTISILLWTSDSSSAGIMFTADSHNARRLVVKDMTLLNAKANGGVAISATYPSVPADLNRSVEVEHVEILPSDLGYWTMGIYLSDAWHPVINDVMIRGQNLSTAMGHGIYLDGRTTSAVIHQVRMYNMNHAIWVSSDSEEIHVTDGTFVYVTTGIRLNAAPGAMIRNNHIAAGQFGVVALDQAQADYARAI